MQQLRGGEKFGFSLAEDVDLAHKAASDQLILGGIYLTLNQAPDEIRVASTNIWISHRGADQSVSVEQLSAMITGQRTHWSNGVPFQMCLRSYPDPVEELLVLLIPRLGDALRQARQDSLWPIFDEDSRLITHLATHPGSIGLFTEGNLKLRGAPLSQLKLQKMIKLSVIATLKLSLNTSSALKPLLDLLSSHDRTTAVSEWGWTP